MGRNSLSPEMITPSLTAADDSNNGDLGFRSSLFKRSHPHSTDRTKFTDRHPRNSSSGGGRIYHNRRKPFQFKGGGWSLIYFVILLAVFSFALASMILQSSITSVFRQGRSDRGRLIRSGLHLGSSLKFVPVKKLLDEDEVAGKVDRLRRQHRVSIRQPRLAVILGNMKKNPESLLLSTVLKNLQQLGYVIKLYATEDGEARMMWEQIDGRISIISPDRYGHLDWSLFEGVIADSLEAKEFIASLMQEPFCSVPLIWIIQEDTLAKRLPFYLKMGWDHIFSHWKKAFSRADVVVFPDFSLPMLYSILDSGNFFVVPGSPVDVWAAENYVQTHSKFDMRTSSGYEADDLLVVVVGSSFFYNELSLDFAVAMHTISPLLVKYAKRKDTTGSFKFIFVCGNSTNAYADALQEVASHLRLTPGSIKHHDMNGDLNRVLLMADIVIYGSSQDEQGFPSLLVRAMSFGIPIMAPDLPLIKNYVVDGVHGMIFRKNNPEELLKAFSLLVSREGGVSRFGNTVGSSGKLLAKNLLASECIRTYAKLLEHVLEFPSDVSLPQPVSQSQHYSWDWNFFREVTEQRFVDMINNEGPIFKGSNVVYALEEDMNDLDSRNRSDGGEDVDDALTSEDWDALREIEIHEEFERVELDQVNERMEKEHGIWDEVYRNARKSEKLRFESNERDEGELERTGQPVCIYEIYSGSGAWPLLHHGSLYRGLSLSMSAQRLSSDDIDAVTRLPLLNDSFYRDVLCEIGGMFSVANKVDEIHRRPWIGFQSWRAAGRKVALSAKAEKVLEETILQQTNGDVMYFWTSLDRISETTENNNSLTFWSMCDILNGGQCRIAFEYAFRHMHGLPASIEALPLMPEDGGRWSALHSWVMPTPSFVEFIMFARIFVDSLDAVHRNMSKSSECLFGSSKVERKHCYCRISELLVNVWAYHSAQRMVYIDPVTGVLEEQHPIEQRRGFMWPKYFNSTLLKSMDEDFAEAADDGDMQNEMWLWPRTGEVHWQGVYEKEREQRYRLKMDKKRTVKEKLLDRMKHGYRQKSLGR